MPDSAWGGQETPVGASPPPQEDILADNSGKGRGEGTGFQQRLRGRNRGWVSLEQCQQPECVRGRGERLAPLPWAGLGQAGSQHQAEQPGDTEPCRGWGGGFRSEAGALRLHDPLVTPRLCCPPVKHPPSEPSQFISVPTKTPDKMGFDEVGGAFPRGGGRGPAWRVQQRLWAAGLHDQPEAAAGSAGTHAAGPGRAGDSVPAGGGCGRQVSWTLLGEGRRHGWV